MKHLLSFACAMTLAISSFAQITFGGSYGIGLTLVKLQSSGYKYLIANTQSQSIKLYNTNHSLWKTIAIPPQPAMIQNIFYVSENLFDTDNQIEYLINTFTMTQGGPNPAGTYTAKAMIYKETGTLLFSIDSAMAISSSNDNIFSNTDGVFDDGTGAKLKVYKYDTSDIPVPAFKRYDIYNLPGTIPCNACGSSTANTTSLSKNTNATKTETVFYPNPASDLIKINYTLPSTYKKAFIRIQDAQGKVVDSYEVTSDFSDLLIPASYKNGLYLYTLEVDGNIIKTEKIIVSK